jgi:uncharacterized phage infection (PIP) family protein YhgE
MTAFSRLRFEVYSKDLSQALSDLSQEQMIFDLRKISKDNLVKELDKGDAQAGTTERTQGWSGDQVLEVNWNKKSPEVKLASITGFEPGAIRAKLDDLKKKTRERRTQSLARLDAAHEKVASVDAEIEKVAAQIEKEANDGLQEFAEFTNFPPGGPA